MASELGAIRVDGADLYVMLPQRSGLLVSARWMRICPHEETICTALRALETGTVIDHRVLLERGEVNVIRHAPTKITEAGLERLLDAAELLEGRQ